MDQEKIRNQIKKELEQIIGGNSLLNRLRANYWAERMQILTGKKEQKPVSETVISCANEILSKEGETVEKSQFVSNIFSAINAFRFKEYVDNKANGKDILVPISTLDDNLNIRPTRELVKLSQTIAILCKPNNEGFKEDHVHFFRKDHKNFFCGRGGLKTVAWIREESWIKYNWLENKLIPIKDVV
jgi:hypothetical protein